MNECRHLIIERYPPSSDDYQCQQCLETFEVRPVAEKAGDRFVVDFPKFEGSPDQLPRADVLSVEIDGSDLVVWVADLWIALVKDITAEPCKFPCLRDDLIDWLKHRASNTTNETQAAGQ